jgi:two-component system, cell cycle response regulator CtrA
MQRDVATKEMILTALYNGMDEPQAKIIDVFVCKMRKKLQSFGIEISTLWGRGYYLTREMKDKVRALREQELTTPEAAAA